MATINKPMSKSQFLSHMAEVTGFRKAEVILFMDELQKVAYKECRNPKGFNLMGFGKLLMKDQKARLARNPATGATVKVPAKKVLKFRLAKATKLAILGAPKKAEAVVEKKVDKKKKKK